MRVREVLMCFLVLISSSCAVYDKNNELSHEISKAENLYKCHYFFEDRSESVVDIILKSKLSQISNSLLLQADMVVQEAGVEGIGDKISYDGKVKYKRFLDKVTGMKHNKDRNLWIKDFTQSCANESGIIWK